VPIGRPVSNVRTYVLDDQFQPVPAGVPGELCVGGVQVGRGYLGRPGLTAERFIPDPFSAAPGARLYRTGDLARYRSDGTLEYLGRIDFQVKLRGFRIELGEVEEVLKQHPAVHRGVVIAREDRPGDQRLVAYVVPAPGEPFDPRPVRAFLSEKLPEYMVPSAFVALEALPLTPSGKVDRKALPAPEHTGSDDRPHVAPRDNLELQLARVWEEVLGVRPVGVTSNFFELGGHSLLALRLMAGIRGSLGRTLPVVSLFQAPTVEGLANLLRRQRQPAPWSPLVPIERRGTRRPFFCVHPVGGNVLAYAELARRLGPDQPFYGLQARGLEEELKPCQTIEEMAALYLSAVRAVQPSGPYRLGGWSMGGVVAYEMAQELRRQGETVEVLALFDSHATTTAQPPPPSRELEEARMAILFARSAAAELFGGTLPHSDEELALMSPDALLRLLLEESQKAGVVIPEAGIEQVRALRAVFEANLRAVERYVPRPYPGPVTLFRAAEAPPSTPEPGDLGWGALAAGGLEVHQVPGHHHSILRAPNVQVLADRLRAHLAAASAAQP
jgi:thioesterase domain-containing protein